MVHQDLVNKPSYLFHDTMAGYTAGTRGRGHDSDRGSSSLMLSRRFRTRPNSNRHGFTLMETVLAVSLSALLIALIGAGMRLYTSTVADRRADVVNARVARIVFQRIGNDLSAAYTVSQDEESGASSDLGATDDLAADGGLGAGTTDEASIDTTVDLVGNAVQVVPGIYGNQFELQIDILGKFPEPVRYDMGIASSGDPLASNLLSEPKTVTWSLRSASSTELAGTPLESVESNERESMTILSRRVQTRAVAVNSASAGLADLQSGEQLLSDQIVSLQFQYHDGYDWTDTWDSSTMGLPIAVKVTLTVSDPSLEDYGTVELSVDNTFEMVFRVPAAEALTSTTTGV